MSSSISVHAQNAEPVNYVCNGTGHFSSFTLKAEILRTNFGLVVATIVAPHWNVKAMSSMINDTHILPDGVYLDFDSNGKLLRVLREVISRRSGDADHYDPRVDRYRRYKNCQIQ